MTIELDSLRLRLENIQRKCAKLLEKEHSYYSCEHYRYLWDNFARIRDMLQTYYPGSFDDIPKRQFSTEEVHFEEVITYSALELLAGDVEDCLSYLAKLPDTAPGAVPESAGVQSIPEHVRRDIFDFIRLQNCCWFGRLGEVEFLERLYKLDELPSTDRRFINASGDIWQHRVNNEDWDNDWVFSDDRFELLRGDDVILLEFLCQMVHPVVRDDATEAEMLITEFNKHLSTAGWQIVAQTTIAGRSVYGAVRSYSSMLKTHLNSIHETLNTEYISKLLNRMHSSIESDPELAIGSAKELIESVSRTVLTDQNIAFSKDDNVQQLVKKALKELKLDPDDMPHTTKAMDSIKPLLKSLGTIAHMTAELRGQFGTGHGKDARTKGLGPRHAKLAVGAASALAVFMYETYLERQKTTPQVVSTEKTV